MFTTVPSFQNSLEGECSWHKGPTPYMETSEYLIPLPARPLPIGYMVNRFAQVCILVCHQALYASLV